MLISGKTGEIIRWAGSVSISCAHPGCDFEVLDTAPSPTGLKLSVFAYNLGWRICKVSPDAPRAAGYFAGYFCPVHLVDPLDIRPEETLAIEAAFMGNPDEGLYVSVLADTPRSQESGARSSSTTSQKEGRDEA